MFIDFCSRVISYDGSPRNSKPACRIISSLHWL